MCWNAAPTFWSTKRLDKITTSALRVPGSGTRQVVDEYQLDQTFPVLKTGPNTALWLKSITRTGYGLNTAANERITLNAVKFESNTEDMPNRVKKDNRPGFSRLRIGRVINEYGGETVVNYRKPVGDCSTGTGLPGKGDTAALKNNDRLCYPAYWHPDPEAEEIDWFHKYVSSRSRNCRTWTAPPTRSPATSTTGPAGSWPSRSSRRRRHGRTRSSPASRRSPC